MQQQLDFGGDGTRDDGRYLTAASRAGAFERMAEMLTAVAQAMGQGTHLATDTRDDRARNDKETDDE